MMTENIVKRCPCCGQSFTLEDILNIPEIIPIGMCFDHSDPQVNVFMFNHQIDGCNTTFCLQVEHFSTYVDGVEHREKLNGREECERHCMSPSDMATCSQPCYFAPYRRLLVRMLEAKKQHENNSQNS